MNSFMLCVSLMVVTISSTAQFQHVMAQTIPTSWLFKSENQINCTDGYEHSSINNYCKPCAHSYVGKSGQCNIQCKWIYKPNKKRDECIMSSAIEILQILTTNITTVQKIATFVTLLSPFLLLMFKKVFNLLVKHCSRKKNNRSREVTPEDYVRRAASYNGRNYDRTQRRSQTERFVSDQEFHQLYAQYLSCTGNGTATRQRVVSDFDDYHKILYCIKKCGNTLLEAHVSALRNGNRLQRCEKWRNAVRQWLEGRIKEAVN
eukprot:8658_1